jgi:hypothetical protein
VFESLSMHQVFRLPSQYFSALSDPTIDHHLHYP